MGESLKIIHYVIFTHNKLFIIVNDKILKAFFVINENIHIHLFLFLYPSMLISYQCIFSFIIDITFIYNIFNKTFIFNNKIFYLLFLIIKNSKLTATRSPKKNLFVSNYLLKEKKKA